MPSFEDLCSHLPVAAFAPGEALLEEGAATGRLYVLRAGTVEIVKRGVQINTVSDCGAIFGEMSALLDAPLARPLLVLESPPAWLNTPVRDRSPA